MTDGAESAEDLSSGHGGARADHWDAVYGGSAEDAVSWFEPEPTVSLQLLDRVGAVPTDPIVDVGAGAARLVDALLDRAFSDVTVLDVSEVGLAQARRRLGERAQRVRWVVADLLSLQPPRRYRVWHDRAAEVAQAAQARLVVVTAYRDDDAGTAPSPVQGMHRDIYGAETAREALAKSVSGLTRERARYIEQRLVRGDPAQALLETVGSNPANLIVVGNRGLGASEGQLLGSVPAGVVKNAVCDVLVVQTSALDEDRLNADRLFTGEPAEAAVDDSRPVTGADPGGRSPTQ